MGTNERQGIIWSYERFPRLRTSRLELRGFRKEDAADVQRLAGDRAIAEMTLCIPHPYEDGMAEDWISGHQSDFEAGRCVTLAIVQADSGDLVGAIGLMGISIPHSRAEIGYWVGKPWWNRGYATEALMAVITYGFDVLKLNRLFAQHLARNPASGRVMEKAGMVREGVLRQHCRKWDRFEDMVMYGILRREWKCQASLD